MFQEFASRVLTARSGLILCLSLTATAGWGSFAVSSQSSAKMERQLRLQVTNLQEAQTQLLTESTRIQAALSEVAQLRTDLAAARSEIARLSQPLNQAQPEPPPTRPEAPGHLPSNETSNDGSKTGVTGTKTTRPELIKTASGEKLVPQERNGQSAARIRLQGVQNATERPRRGGKAPKATELDTAGLRQLTTSAEAQTH